MACHFSRNPVFVIFCISYAMVGQEYLILYLQFSASSFLVCFHFSYFCIIFLYNNIVCTLCNILHFIAVQFCVQRIFCFFHWQKYFAPPAAPMKVVEPATYRRPSYLKSQWKCSQSGAWYHWYLFPTLVFWSVRPAHPRNPIYPILPASAPKDNFTDQNDTMTIDDRSTSPQELMELHPIQSPNNVLPFYLISSCLDFPTNGIS